MKNNQFDKIIAEANNLRIDLGNELNSKAKKRKKKGKNCCIFRELQD